jgi:toxin ParE1/3/4
LLEWVVPRLPYIVVYEVDEARGEVIVAAVFHGAQNREGEE